MHVRKARSKSCAGPTQSLGLKAWSEYGCICPVRFPCAYLDSSGPFRDRGNSFTPLYRLEYLREITAVSLTTQKHEEHKCSRRYENISYWNGMPYFLDSTGVYHDVSFQLWRIDGADFCKFFSKYSKLSSLKSLMRKRRISTFQ